MDGVLMILQASEAISLLVARLCVQVVPLHDCFYCVIVAGTLSAAGN
jgi:hypothetical protein